MFKTNFHTLYYGWDDLTLFLYFELISLKLSKKPAWPMYKVHKGVPYTFDAGTILTFVLH